MKDTMWEDFGTFSGRYVELTEDERNDICLECLGEPHNSEALQGEASVLFEELMRGNLDVDFLRPFFGPREYVVTQTITRTGTVKALSVAQATRAKLKTWEDKTVVQAAKLKLAKPRCEMHLYRDDDYDLDEHFDYEEDKAAARKHGMVGFSLRVAYALDASGEPIFEDGDGCGGFINTLTVLDDMFEQADLPQGVARDDVEVYFEGDQI